MIRYESKYSDELMHYGKKGMKWRVRRKKKLKTGKPKDTYVWGSHDTAQYNKMSRKEGHQAWTAKMNAANAKLRKRWDYGR